MGCSRNQFQQVIMNAIVASIVHRYSIFSLAAIGLFSAIAPDQPLAQYPERSIKIIVGYPAGGGSDIVARTVAHNLSQQLGRVVVVENEPGASGMIDADYGPSARLHSLARKLGCHPNTLRCLDASDGNVEVSQQGSST